ncbi:MAG: tryptophan--tRNA ligase [Parcubacteria group bacterium]|nr:tryptophan--tRNA ligase [Parcubacteria group bacterium]
MKPRILSGVAPSGNIHIGNYIGALKQWVSLQDQYDNFFCVVDHHAITVRQNPADLRAKSLEVAKLYFACGIDPEKSAVFIQSHVPAHTELSWILSTITRVNEMERMTQFKEKAAKNVKNINIGLMTYPILMAADIFLYQANLVPVGEDQTQHLEFARSLAERFNREFAEVLTLPEQFTPPQGARIMSLAEPANKMSKSDKKTNATIGLLDEPDVIKAKIARAVTDSGSTVEYASDKPALKNLLTIYSACSGQSIPDIVKHYDGMGYKLFKEGLAKVVIEHLRPIQERYKQLDADPTMFHALLSQGAEKANLVASATLRNVKEAVGYALL